MVCQKVETIATFIERCGPERSIDMDSIGMRLALDVVALVSSPPMVQCTVPRGSPTSLLG